MLAKKWIGMGLALAAGMMFTTEASALGKKKSSCEPAPAPCAPATKTVTCTEYVKVPVEKTVTVKQCKMVPVKETVEVTRCKKTLVTEEVPVTKCVDMGHYECREVTVARKTGCCKKSSCETTTAMVKTWVPDIQEVQTTKKVTRCVKVPVTETVERTRLKKVVEEKEVTVTAYECVPVTVTKEVSCEQPKARKLCR